MTSRVRTALLSSGILGVTGIALGALGAHAMAATLAERGTTHAWETAARYHIVHALALLGAAIWLRGVAGNLASRVHWAARCWTIGVVLFSGSLYWLAIGAPRWVGPITPIGGLFLLAGWAFIIAASVGSAE